VVHCGSVQYREASLLAGESEEDVAEHLDRSFSLRAPRRISARPIGVSLLLFRPLRCSLSDFGSRAHTEGSDVELTAVALALQRVLDRLPRPRVALEPALPPRTSNGQGAHGTSSPSRRRRQRAVAPTRFGG